MVRQRCPNCKAARIKDAEHCICGYKWVESTVEEVAKFLDEMGITLTELEG